MNMNIIILYCRSSNRKTPRGNNTMDHSQYVFLGRHSIIEFRQRTPTAAYGKPNWCLQCPRHRKNGKRDIKRVPKFKSNILSNDFSK